MSAPQSNRESPQEDADGSVSTDHNVINSYRQAEPIIKKVLSQSLPSLASLDEQIEEDGNATGGNTVDKVYSERIQYRSLDLRPTTGASPKIVETAKPETALEARRRLRVERIRKQRAMRKARKKMSLSKETKDGELAEIEAQAEKIMSKTKSRSKRPKLKKIDIRADLWNWIRQNNKALRPAAASKGEVSQLPMSQFERLAELWADYARNLIFPFAEESDNNKKARKNTPADVRQISMSAAGKIASADLHGCRLTVVRARCISLVGIQGIVAVDSKNSFVLAVDAVTKNRYSRSPADNINGSTVINTTTSQSSPYARLVTVPKFQTVFQLVISTPPGLYNQAHLTLNINGSRLMFRSAERSSRKFKSRQADDLI